MLWWRKGHLDSVINNQCSTPTSTISNYHHLLFALVSLGEYTHGPGDSGDSVLDHSMIILHNLTIKFKLFYASNYGLFMINLR